MEKIDIRFNMISDGVKRIIEKEASLLDHSDIWQTCSNLLSYMLDLSPKSLRNVRIHTDVFTGEHLNGVLFGARCSPDPAAYAEGLGYVFATENLPSEYWISEPPIDRWFEGGTYGSNYNGKVVNIELARYQLYIENFIATGMVADIKNSQSKKLVMEIGAGYGAIGHHLMNLTNHNICYLVLDLPLMLLYTGSYIAEHHPNAKIFIYDPDNEAHKSLDDSILDYDVVLIPNHRLSILENLTKIDYAINIFSLAEMTENQVQSYVDFIRPRLQNYFFFQNYLWAFEKPLHLYIGDQFHCSPSLDFFDRYIHKTGAASFPARTFFFTSTEEAHQRVNESTIKIRLPDLRLGTLALADENVMIRESPNNYVSFSLEIEEPPADATLEEILLPSDSTMPLVEVVS